MKRKNFHKVLFYLLFIGILLLFLNDRLWKYEYSNWMTGKLSDFLGLLTLPLFLSILFPRIKTKISLIIGLLFILWKLPVTDNIINFWNHFIIFKISRTIDYSDLLALTVLPFTHKILIQLNIQEFQNSIKSKFHKPVINLLILFSCIVFCSTSVEEPSYPKGDIYIGENIKVAKTKNQILELLRQNGQQITTDSIWYFKYYGKKVGRVYYQIDTLIPLQQYRRDTLLKINFDIYEKKKGCNITLINLSVKENWELQNWKELKKKSKEYNIVLKKEISRILEQE